MKKIKDFVDRHSIKILMGLLLLAGVSTFLVVDDTKASKVMLGNTINIVSPGAGNDIRTNALAAIATAVDGDLVLFPSGSFTVSQTITITKKIRLGGAGIGNTILYRDEATSDATLTGWGPMILFNINSDTRSNVEVYGIEARSQIPLITLGDGGSLAADVGLKFINCVDFKVHDCKFMYFGNGGIDVRHRDYLARGLIYNCQFFRNAKGLDGLGLGYGVVIYGEGLQWIKSVKFGTPDAIFIENCDFKYHRHSVACAGASRYVIRYSTFDFNIISPPYSHCIDTHQDRGIGLGTNTYGARITEVYNNTITNTTRTDGTTAMANGCPDDKIEERAIGCGNGDMVVHDNTISGFRFAVGVYQGESGSVPYPYLHQIGYASGKSRGRNHTGISTVASDGDLWVWSNNFTTFTLTGGGACQYLWNYTAAVYGGPGVSTDYIALDRDYHLSAKPGYVPYPYPHPRRTN